MNEIHAAGEYPETSQNCEKMLGAALEETELRGIVDELSRAQRMVVHSDDHITVLDSRFDNHWQRCELVPALGFLTASISEASFPLCFKEQAYHIPLSEPLLQ